MGGKAGRRPAAVPGPHPARRGRVPPGHCGQPRRVHPVHALRARLPRGAGQRRDRAGLPRRPREDRLRLRRPDGRLHLRGVRRVRAGLPDWRADAGARGRARGNRQDGRIALPVLRRRLPAHLSRREERHQVRDRPRRPGQPRAPVRERPLRVRLRAPSAAAHQAAHPQARRAEVGVLHRRPGKLEGSVP